MSRRLFLKTGYKAIFVREHHTKMADIFHLLGGNGGKCFFLFMPCYYLGKISISEKIAHQNNESRILQESAASPDTTGIAGELFFLMKTQIHAQLGTIAKFV